MVKSSTLWPPKLKIILGIVNQLVQPGNKILGTWGLTLDPVHFKLDPVWFLSWTQSDMDPSGFWIGLFDSSGFLDPVELWLGFGGSWEKKCSHWVWKFVMKKLWTWDPRRTHLPPLEAERKLRARELHRDLCLVVLCLLFFGGCQGLFQSPLLSPGLLKDKSRHITIFKSLFEQDSV